MNILSMLLLLVFTNGAFADSIDDILRKQFSAPSKDPIQDIGSYMELETLIRQNNVKTIDDLIAVLPADYKSGYTLIYNTRALNRSLVTPKRPRVLMYGAKGNFLMTFNSNPSGGSAVEGDVETLETIEFGSGAAKLRELTFNGKISPVALPVDVNPAKCTQCHGSDPRGLWEPYNTWPGVYGSLSRGSVDFIRMGTTEYNNFQIFLNERETNPRYSALSLYTFTLADLNKRLDALGLKMLRPFVPAKMADGITFTDGQTLFTNQRVGMIIANHNFNRLGKILAALPEKTRAAYQYLVKGISLDEKGDEPTLGTFKNLYTDKKFTCLPKIDSFFPVGYFDNGRMRYQDFHKSLIEQIRNDYSSLKAEVERENLGLSKTSAGFNGTDPFDLDAAGRDLIYDAQAPPLVFDNKFNPPGKPFVGQGGTAIPFLFQVLGIPQPSYSTSARGSDYNLYYGNHVGCIGPRGEYPLGWGCFVEDIEAFVTLHVPQSFYSDPNIESMNCDELAQKSRAGISKL